MNLDNNNYWSPDIVADVSEEDLIGRRIKTDRFGHKEKSVGYTHIVANDVLEHIPILYLL